MSEKAEYARSISFTQSVSTGYISFHGSIHFDTKQDYEKIKSELVDMLREQERLFGEVYKYKVAKDIVPKEEKKKGVNDKNE